MSEGNLNILLEAGFRKFISYSEHNASFFNYRCTDLATSVLAE